MNRGGGALMIFSDRGGGTHMNGKGGGGHELYTGFNMRSVQAEF